MFIATSVFVIVDGGYVSHQLLKRFTSSDLDPCKPSCQPISNAIRQCRASTDFLCGCDAWIQNTAVCSACTLVHFNSTIIISTVHEVKRAFCICPNDCGQIASAAYGCSYDSDTASKLCPHVQDQSKTCVDCIQKQDPYAAALVGSYFTQLCGDRICFANENSNIREDA